MSIRAGIYAIYKATKEIPYKVDNLDLKLGNLTLPVSRSLEAKDIFKKTTIYPDQKFIDDTENTLNTLLQMMQYGIHYINILACPTCPIKDKCKY